MINDQINLLTTGTPHISVKSDAMKVGTSICNWSGAGCLACSESIQMECIQ